MNEYPILIRLAVSVICCVLLVSFVLVITYQTYSAANAQMEEFVGMSEWSSLDGYNGKIVSRAVARNIARSEYERVPVILGSTGVVDVSNPWSSIGRVPDDRIVAHVRINDFFNAVGVTASTTYTITLHRNSVGEVIALRIS